MASLFRQSRIITSQLACIRRTAASTGTQARTSGASANPVPAAHSGNRSDMAIRDARQQGAVPADAIRPRPAGEPPLIPLVGKSKTVWGQIGFAIVLGLSGYFFYVNYITNPEFYKSLKLSREASLRDSHEQPVNRPGTIGQKIDDAGAPKGALNPHL